MRRLWICAILVLVPPVYGQESSTPLHTDTRHSQNAVQPKAQNPEPKAAPLFKVNQQHEAESYSQSYLSHLFSPENLPNIGLFVGGLIGIFVAVRTLNTIGRQTRVMEQTLALTQRPRIVVRNLRFLKKERPDSPNAIQIGSDCLGQFYIVNYGGSRAHIQERLAMVWVTSEDGPLQAKRPYEELVGDQKKKTLAPGESVTYFFRREDLLGPESPTKIAFRSAFLYVFGWIGYTDDLGIYRRTEFCRMYDPGKDRFTPIDDADYENAD